MKIAKTLVILVLFGLIQLIPYGRNHASLLAEQARRTIQRAIH